MTKTQSPVHRSPLMKPILIITGVILTLTIAIGFGLYLLQQRVIHVQEQLDTYILTQHVAPAEVLEEAKGMRTEVLSWLHSHSELCEECAVCKVCLQHPADEQRRAPR